MEHSFNQSALESVEGWLTPQAALLSRLLVSEQRRLGMVTAVLELGVYRGKYLSLLAAAVGACVPIVGIDAFYSKVGVTMDETSLATAIAAIHNSIERVSGRPSTAVVVCSRSDEIEPCELLDISRRGFSFISVDAGPAAADRVAELSLCEEVLSDCGIVAISGVFCPTVPSEGEGTFAYFFEHPLTDFSPFATGGNKVFVCRREMHPAYYALSCKIAEDASTRFPELAPTTILRQFHAAANWTPTLFGHKVVPFLDAGIANAYGIDLPVDCTV